ncbi:hypothetical protein [Jannaschia pohangensis]|uniref:Uncharacterized protein n=1 Tax=Jannaschia pohangensis TaxID=390807 RepID=A0A1I3QPT4_9RHOB|nr:hypothetical protein [Jannaschia pohangensis]SFJ35291.1 hypothetical protein SAMN04488095_2604 [Jannaschia pohangensis]
MSVLPSRTIVPVALSEAMTFQMRPTAWRKCLKTSGTWPDIVRSVVMPQPVAGDRNTALHVPPQLDQSFVTRVQRADTGEPGDV